MSPIYALLLLLPLAWGGWTPTFQDEFNGKTKVDTKAWNVFYRFSPDAINQELQYYAPDGFVATSTSLKIAAQKRITVVNNKPQFNYTSGAITTSHKFNQTYGYYEMRAKFPNTTGYWPAFWLLPERSDSAGAQEIDVVEMIMNQPKTVYTTFHCNYSTGGAKGSSKTYTNWDVTQYHTYGVQWIPGLLIWYVDGVQVWNFSSPCIPNKPAYLLANLAVGGSWPGPPTASTVFPSYMEIDYIRVYKYSATGSSVTGPGAGIPYTALSDPIPNIRVATPTSSPETAAIGQVVTVWTVVVTDSVAYSGLIVQYAFYNTARTSLGSTSKTVNVPAYSSLNVSATWTIPTTATNGTFISWALGIFTSGWATNIFWENTASVIGVNRIVGASNTL